MPELQLLSVDCFLSLNGGRIVRVLYPERRFWLTYEDTFDSDEQVQFSLGSINRFTPPVEDIHVIQRRTRQMRRSDFKAGNYIERPGWTGDHFALPDGFVASPADNEIEMVFPNLTETYQKGPIYVPDPLTTH